MQVRVKRLQGHNGCWRVAACQDCSQLAVVLLLSAKALRYLFLYGKLAVDMKGTPLSSVRTHAVPACPQRPHRYPPSWAGPAPLGTVQNFIDAAWRKPDCGATQCCVTVGPLSLLTQGFAGPAGHELGGPQRLGAHRPAARVAEWACLRCPQQHQNCQAAMGSWASAGSL